MNGMSFVIGVIVGAVASYVVTNYGAGAVAYVKGLFA